MGYTRTKKQKKEAWKIINYRKKTGTWGRPKKRTAKQIEASRKNLEKARAAKKRGGSKSIDNMSLGERKKAF